MKFESKMVNEFLKRRPDEFHDIKDPIDILAKMQHYGLPTRLLDVTFNPLVALFFACKDDNIKDNIASTMARPDLPNTLLAPSTAVTIKGWCNNHTELFCPACFPKRE